MGECGRRWAGAWVLTGLGSHKSQYLLQIKTKRTRKKTSVQSDPSKRIATYKERRSLSRLLSLWTLNEKNRDQNEKFQETLWWWITTTSPAPEPNEGELLMQTKRALTPCLLSHPHTSSGVKTSVRKQVNTKSTPTLYTSYTMLRSLEIEIKPPIPTPALLTLLLCSGWPGELSWLQSSLASGAGRWCESGTLLGPDPGHGQ